MIATGTRDRRPWDAVRRILVIRYRRAAHLPAEGGKEEEFMVMLREVRAAEGVTFALGGNPQELQRIADQLATVGNAHLATLVRQAASTAVLSAGGAMASLSVRLGQAGVPHALMEAARGAGLELDRPGHDLGRGEPIDPKLRED